MSRHRKMAALALCALAVFSHLPSTIHAQQPADTTRRTVQGGIYDRPFIANVGRTAVGGYVEGNTNYVVEDGVTEGFTMELRRFNIFLFSSISSRIRFLSELEFEHGTEEIALETALIDVEASPALVFRAGILLPPLGAFNAAHDSPRWDFVDRPLVSTTLIPSTLSEVGFGVHGRLRPANFGLTYDLYATNGLGEGIVGNEEGRTSIPAGKDEEAFGEDNNGSPAISGRIAAQHRRWGELGASFYTGVYNTYKVEGEPVDEARRVSLYALDGTTQLGPVELRGELAFAQVDVPPSLGELFAERQLGWHLDATMPVWRPRLRGFPGAIVKGDLRLEYVDLNQGTFASTGERRGDETRAIVIGASFHPVSGTVIKANYRRQSMRDLFGNAPAKLGALQFGFATYF